MCFGGKKKTQVQSASRTSSGRYIDRYQAKKDRKPQLKEKNGQKMFSQISQTGPIDKRSCTNCCFLIVFLVFVIFQFWYAFYGFTKGDPWALAQPYDIDGNACGANGKDTENTKFAYFFNPIGDLSTTICVEKCPTFQPGETLTTIGNCYIGPVAKIQAGRTAEGIQDCNNVKLLNLDDSRGTLNTYINSNQNTIFYYNTTILLGRYCVPDITGMTDTAKNYYNEMMKGTEGSNFLEEGFSDLRATWGIILASAGAAFVLCIIYMIVMRWCVGIFVWLMILGFFAILVLFAIFFQNKSNYYEDLWKETQSETMYDSHRRYYWSALITYIMLGVFFCLICCYMRTIELCIAVLKSAAIFLKNNFMIIFLPVVMAIFLIGFCIWWLWVLVHLWSVGDYKKRAGLPIGEVQWTSETRIYVYTHLFSLLWIGSFILYFGQFVIILATCLWYFDHHPKSGKAVKGGVIRKAICWSLFYHVGSIAIAALILAIIIALRIIMYYIQQQVSKMKQKGKKGSSCMFNLIFGCMHAMLACAHRIIKVINKSGFITVALKSQGFCLSCLEGFTLLMRNPLKFGLLAVLGEMFTFVGKLFVGILTAALGYIIITQTDTYNDKIYSPFLPTIFFFINGMIVGSVFMSVYGLSADTIMFCYFVERNSNVSEDSLRCPKPMKDFFLSNKSSSSEDERRRNTVKSLNNVGSKEM